ncbi:MAG: tetratricopeptide repeat protein [Desulfobacteraceae bacterium]|jgi:tetratricopeptide (TPR) repeat protein
MNQPFINPRRSLLNSSRKLAFLVIAMFLFCLWGDPENSLAMDQEAGRIINVTGKVEIFKGESRIGQKAIPGLALNQGDIIFTGADGWAAIVLSDESMIQLSANSLLKIKSVLDRSGFGSGPKVLPAETSPEKANYRLEKGQLWLRNKNRGIHIVIDTPFVSAGIRGTEIDLWVKEDRTLLSVLEGQVIATNDFGSLVLEASEQTVSEKDKPLTKQLLLSPDDSVQWTIPVNHLLQDKILFLTRDDYHYLKTEKEKFTTQLSATPYDSRLLIQSGNIYRDLGQSEAAIKVFNQALALEPDQEEASIGIGWVYLDKHMPDQALECFNRIKKHSASLLLGKSVGLFQKGLTDSALNSLDEAIHEFPDYLPFQSFAIQVQIYLREYRNASQSIDKLLKQYPDHAPFWFMDALLKLSKGDKNGALDSVRMSLSFSPNSPSAHILASYVHQAMYDLKTAKEYNNHALSLNEDNCAALNNAARLEFADGNLSEAYGLIEKATAISPGNPETLTLEGFIMLAKRQTRSAISSFTKAIDGDAGLGDPHLGLALAHMRLGDLNRAFDDVSNAVVLEPRRSIFMSYWAKMLYQDKRFQRALELLDLAEKLDPNDPTPLLYRSHILHDLNRPVEAIDALNSAIAKNGNRAVYRSKYLLDHDLAIKNVNLARIYSQLGMSEWGDKKAWESVKYDYDNSAAHDFLANDLEFLSGGAGVTAESEGLKAFLMKPSNINTLNTFNDYTLFFDQPKICGTLAGAAGNHGYYAGDLDIFGAIPSYDLAFRFQGTREYTDGWRTDNDEGLIQTRTSLKWDATQSSTFSVKATTRTREATDSATRTRYYSSPDQENKASDDIVNAGIGLYHRLSPQTSIMLYTKRQFENEVKSTVHSYTFVSPYTLQNWYRQELDEPYTSAQAQFYHRMDTHQFICGAYQYWSDRKYEGSGDLYLDNAGDLIPLPSDQSILTDKHRRQQSYYIHDIFQPNQYLSIEAAVYYDLTEDVNSYYGLGWNQEMINPRFGVRITPTPQQTYSFGYTKYLDPFMAVERIDPIDTAGHAVPYYYEGSVIESIFAGFDYEWKRGCLFIRFYNNEPDYKTTDSVNGNKVEKSYHNRYKGFETAFNQIVLNTFGLAGGYTFFDFDKDEYTPDLQGNNHWLWGSLTYFHSSGFSASLKHSYYYSGFDNPSIAQRDFNITNAFFQYEFPAKWGKAGFEVLNLFDTHFDGTWLSDVAGRVPDVKYNFNVQINF